MLDLTLNPYLAVLVLIVLAAGFLASTLLVGMWLGPKSYSKIKDEPFECGTAGSADVGGRHGARFYLLAMTFIIFDVEIVFLYPWAVNLKQFGPAGFWAMLPFLGLLAVGLVYEARRGVLDVR
ncbi:MAG TPA: NADH-quinone oxidoreductase subunit A [Oligoflexia bacterium]|nr:NADH-quinone oxidoreductase subunit A [Oligoflexia bacterium]